MTPEEFASLPEGERALHQALEATRRAERLTKTINTLITERNTLINFARSKEREVLQ